MFVSFLVSWILCLPEAEILLIAIFVKRSLPSGDFNAIRGRQTESSVPLFIFDFLFAVLVRLIVYLSVFVVVNNIHSRSLLCFYIFSSFKKKKKLLFIVVISLSYNVHFNFSLPRFQHIIISGDKHFLRV